MGGKSSVPPPPDYSSLIAASQQQANQQFQLSKEQLAWAQEQYAADREVIDQIVADSMARAKVNDENAAEDRQRYETIYQPLEDKAVADAVSYSSQERQNYEAGRASASVQEQTEAARQAATRNLESFGVDPTSTRYAAIDAGTRMMGAAAGAGAANDARAQTEAIGRALTSEAINVGRGYPGQVAGTYGTALQSGNQGANSTLGATASGVNSMGTPLGYTQAGMSGINSAGQLTNNSYSNEMAGYTAQQQASSGWGSALGAGFGMLGTEFGPATLGGMMFAEGGAIPMEASPTMGRAVDDVPAALTAGEFVMPQDVVAWKGEEFFQKLIEQSRKMKPQAPAQPSMGPAPPGMGAVMARPQSPASALPVG